MQADRKRGPRVFNCESDEGRFGHFAMSPKRGYYIRIKAFVWD